MSHVHRFAPGEHDEYVCKHILSGHVIVGPVEHVDHEDGSVEVTFPIPAETVQTALASYVRDDYIRPPAVTLTADDIAVLKAVAEREKATEGKVA